MEDLRDLSFVKNLLASFKREVERYLERIEAAQTYGLEIINIMREPMSQGIEGVGLNGLGPSVKKGVSLIKVSFVST
jgi:hypothetical protein